MPAISICTYRHVYEHMTRCVPCDVPTLNFAIKAETTGFIQGDVHQDVHKEGVCQGFPEANVWGPPVHPADIRITDIKDFFVCALITVRLATYFRSRRHFS